MMSLRREMLILETLSHLPFLEKEIELLVRHGLTWDSHSLCQTFAQLLSSIPAPEIYLDLF